MTETADVAIAVGGSLTGILAAFLYSLYRNKNRAAIELKKSEMVMIGAELKKRLAGMERPCLPYATVQGIVMDQGRTFQTDNSPTRGVILHTSVVEHNSKRTNGVWSDVKKVIMENLESAPFALLDKDSPDHLMLVSEATEAQQLMDDLEQTHHEFIPHQSSFLRAGVDRMFGQVCRGHEKSEKMLAVGTTLLGVGEIILEDGKLKLRAPQTEGFKYYLTTMSKAQLIKSFRAQATTLKIVSIIFGIVASTMIGLAVWRMTKKYFEHRKTQREIEEIRRVTLRRRERTAEDRTLSEEDQLCVVCLDNPREVVILDCGHICMCTDCAQALPNSFCPVCREHIERFLPVYRP